MAENRVVVIGAGVGGLAAALELSSRGLDVTVCERAATTGGKVREIPLGSAAVDAGPTVFTMRWVFEELFARCGLCWPDSLTLAPVEVLARHAWLQGGRLDLYPDAARTAEAIGDLSGAAEARRYLAFTREAERLYRGLEGPFIRAANPTPLSIAGKVGFKGLGSLTRMGPFASLWHCLGRYFHDTRLRQLFARYATYVGSSPFDAPATLMLVAHVEREGVWIIEGGMYRLVDTLTRCLTGMGAQLRTGAEVTEILIERNRVRGVRLHDGECIEADAVVCNADVAALGDGLFGTRARAAVEVRKGSAQRSLSALTWTLLGNTSGFPLSHHNVFFSDDYAAEFRDLFGAKRLPATPTVYVCAQDRGANQDAAPAPGGQERLFCLVNAPATADGAGLHAQEIEVCEHRTFQVLERCGLHVDRQHGNGVLTSPREFEALFPATGGALYGAACHGWKSSFARPGARTRVAGLYMAGGSVHPGPGVPMAALSGHLAASALVTDLAG